MYSKLTKLIFPYFNYFKRTLRFITFFYKVLYLKKIAVFFITKETWKNISLLLHPVYPVAAAFLFSCHFSIRQNMYVHIPDMYVGISQSMDSEFSPIILIHVQLVVDGILFRFTDNCVKKCVYVHIFLCVEQVDATTLCFCAFIVQKTNTFFKFLRSIES